MPEKNANDRFLYYLDEAGRKQDAEIHHEILENPEAQVCFALQVIHDEVAEGGSLDVAIARYAPPVLQQAYEAGEFGWDHIVEVVTR